MEDFEKELKEEDEYEMEDAPDREEQEFKDEYEDKQHESTAPAASFKDELDYFTPPLPLPPKLKETGGRKKTKKKAAGKSAGVKPKKKGVKPKAKTRKTKKAASKPKT